jgi:predicted nucleotidyltransferase
VVLRQASGALEEAIRSAVAGHDGWVIDHDPAVAEEASAVLERLAHDIRETLGESLLGLYVHGSWVMGDFHPRRSDLDLLAVLAQDPTPALVNQLTTLLERLVADYPGWTNRIEGELLSSAALSTFRDGSHDMVRVSPGEPPHLLPVSSHYLLNWDCARRHGRALHGPEPTQLLPEFTRAEVIGVVREHLAQWPAWVQDHQTPESQAYVVLTVCRALYTISEGGHLTKRKAAEYAATRLPEWSELIQWANDLWYLEPGAVQVDRHRSTADFIDAVAAATAT